MNVRLLRNVQKHILAEPRRLDMYGWRQRFGKREIKNHPSLPPCGTVACIAGWATALTAVALPASHGNGMAVLGLDYDAAQRLFYLFNWPDKFRCAHRYAKGDAGRARATVRRIDHFIKTGGAE